MTTMTMLPRAVGSTVQFSTRRVPAARRLTALRDLFDRSVQLEISAPAGLAVDMNLDLLPGMRRAHMASALTARMSRPSSMLSDGEDTVCLMMKTAGFMSVRQQHRQATPEPGDAMLLVYRQSAELEFVDASYVAVRVPFKALSLAHQLEDAAACCIPRQSQALSLLKAYLQCMPEPQADPQLVGLYVSHLYDLVSLALGATVQGRELAKQRGVRAARLATIQQALTQDPALTLEQVALQQGITPRYIQMLFEDAGTTFGHYVLDCKLQAAHQMLSSPRYAGQSVTDIAYDAGFADLSHFNRRFKQRYAMTPRELRGQAKPH